MTHGITKNSLFDGLHKILTGKISNRRFYEARCRGFRSEIAFATLAKKRNWSLLDGGQFLFTRIDWPTKKENSVVYVTVSFDSSKNYVSLYSILSKLNVFRDGFFVSIKGLNQWTDQQIKVKNSRNRIVLKKIPRPKFDVFRFANGQFVASKMSDITGLFPKRRTMVCQTKSRNVLSYITGYEKESLACVYSNRFFLDIELDGFKKGMIDLDGILKKGDAFTAVETKEKDPLKETYRKNDWYFGWDSRRIGWYLYLKEQIDLDSLYVIREIDNQTSRNFLCWKKISLEGFCDCTSWLSEHGGGGGGHTIVAPYVKFKKL